MNEKQTKGKKPVTIKEENRFVLIFNAYDAITGTEKSDLDTLLTKWCFGDADADWSEPDFEEVLLLCERLYFMYEVVREIIVTKFEGLDYWGCDIRPLLKSIAADERMQPETPKE